MSNNKKIKIAIFQKLPKGGGERTNLEIIKRLKEKYSIKEFTFEHITLKNFFDYLIFIYIKLPKIHKTLANQIKKGNFDLLICNHDYFTKSPYILRYIDIPKLYFCQEEPREFYFDKKYLLTSLKQKIINYLRLPLKYIDKNNIKYANILVTNSEFSKQKLEKIYRKKFNKIYLGVNQKIFHFKNDIKKENYFITVGSTSKFKGIDFLIRTIALLPKNVRYPLIIIGDKGRDHKYINYLAKKMQVKIIQKNKISDSELNDLYNKSKLLLAAAINEPFGLSLIESLSAGTRVIAINEGGYKEIISNKKLGYLTERNEKLFAEKINLILKEKIDRQFLFNYVKKNWNWDNTIKNLSILFPTNP
ncbi:glycosyltransferase family 4 protein [Candidatus Beckwithbacteria bacterium]|nr:glycosyltransferase family 4 protein [Candidatus Beckwithbacteria bacterium]